MSEFLNKSLQSKTAGDMLLKQSLFGSSVSRFYYAYLQFLLHIMATKLSHKKEEYEKLRKENEGSHQFASRVVGLELAHKNSSEYKWFQTKNQELKEIRVDADYTISQIGHDRAVDAQSRADALIHLLKKNFK